jgi:hypothetical protein
VLDLQQLRFSCLSQTSHPLGHLGALFPSLTHHSLSPSLHCPIALVSQEKTDDDPVLPEKLVVAKARMLQLAKQAAHAQILCGLDVVVEDYCKAALNFGLVQVRARWVTLRARWVDAKSSLGDAESSLGGR